MSTLIRQRCLNHEPREAVAKCPGCGNFFCRECVSEHDDQLLCARCLKVLAGETPAVASPAPRFRSLLAATAGLLFTWIIFYSLGQALLSVDSSVHDGTVWESGDDAEP